MQCPNCHLENPEGTETCQGCGLIFAKWRERHAATAAPPDAPASPDPSTGSGQDAAPTENVAPETYSERLKKSLPERQYSEFPVKKFIIISVVLLLVGVGLFIFMPTTPGGYATPQVLGRPTNVSGSAYEGTVEPTETPLPCNYPFDTCTPTPIPTPKTIEGAPWKYHGRVLDELHATPIGGAQISFYNNGVGVTVTTNEQGLFQISVPPLSGKETYEVEVSHPNFRYGYWMEDPTGFSQQDRLARAYQETENQHLRGVDGGGGEDENLVFSLFPGQLTEEEQMWLRNANPNQPSQ